MRHIYIYTKRLYIAACEPPCSTKLELYVALLPYFRPGNPHSSTMPDPIDNLERILTKSYARVLKSADSLPGT